MKSFTERFAHSFHSMRPRQKRRRPLEKLFASYLQTVVWHASIHPTGIPFESLAAQLLQRPETPSRR